MPPQPWKSAWGTIDAAADPEPFIQTMELYRGGRGDDPAYYPFLSFLAAREGSRILDLGCGLGGATRVLAPRVGGSGRVIGLDNSRAMIAAARKRTPGRTLPIDFAVGDARALPFADATFDGAFSVATFELVGEPELALDEVIRVIRPEGKLVVNAADFGSWILDTADVALTDRILRFARDRQTNGRIGRQLQRLFVERGLVDVGLICHGAAFTDFEFYWQIWLGPWVADAVQCAVITSAEAIAWHADLQDRAEAGLFLLAGVDFTVIGTKRD
ncbi:MAG TPA: methyltransferase domain-containing protein [Chloroflexota bacterium]|nr:methyltransferase domain-containing protein [Chloroflexota bacterium]